MSEPVDAFLSHNKADKAWTRELAARLEAETIDGKPNSRKIRVFLDEWDIEGGENVVLKLGRALDAGAFVVAVLSPEFFESGWTAFEWTDVVAKDPANREGRLLAIRRRDVSLDGVRRIALLAPFNALRHFDFRTDSEFESRFEDLLRRIRKQPLARGKTLQSRYSSTVDLHYDSHPIHAPDELEEMLISNLAPLAEHPTRIWFADTSFRSMKELPAQMDVGPWTFRFWDGKLVTFADLENPECGLGKLIDPYSIGTTTFETCLRSEEWMTQWLALANKVLATSPRF